MLPVSLVSRYDTLCDVGLGLLELTGFKNISGMEQKVGLLLAGSTSGNMEFFTP